MSLVVDSLKEISVITSLFMLHEVGFTNESLKTLNITYAFNPINP